jgi:hypothetical protein
VDGDERVQAGSPPAAHDHILVVEGLLVSVYRRIVLRVGGSIRARPVHGAGGGDQDAIVEVDDPVPVVVGCELPVLVLVLEVVEPSVAVEPGCVVELDELDGCPVSAVVDEVVDGSVDVVDVADPFVGCLRPLPASVPTGAAPPPLVVADVPPVACDFSLIGTATVVVAVVTVVGTPADGVFATGAIRVCGCDGCEATAGASWTGWVALEDVAGVADACVTWWLAGATVTARAC